MLRELDPALYAELRSIAARALRGERDPARHGTTSLVHEIWLRIARSAAERGPGEGNLLALASTVARRALVDAARRRRAAKRGAGGTPMPLSAGTDPETPATPDEIVAIDELLSRLATDYPRQAKALEMRSFGGFDPNAIAGALGISPTQAKRDVAFARAWIVEKLAGADGAAGRPASDPPPSAPLKPGEQGAPNDGAE